MKKKSPLNLTNKQFLETVKSKNNTACLCEFNWWIQIAGIHIWITTIHWASRFLTSFILVFSLCFGISAYSQYLPDFMNSPQLHVGCVVVFFYIYTPVKVAPEVHIPLIWNHCCRICQTQSRPTCCTCTHIDDSDTLQYISTCNASEFKASRFQSMLMHHFVAYATHPPGFTLVFNRLLSVWYRPLHIVYRVLHIVLYAVYHLPLGEVSYRGGVEDMKKEGQMWRQEEEWIQMQRRWGKGGE